MVRLEVQRNKTVEVSRKVVVWAREQGDRKRTEEGKVWLMEEMAGQRNRKVG